MSTPKEIVRLITAKSVLGSVPELEAGVKYKPLFRVWGMANGTKAVSGGYDENGEKLVGAFEALNLETGETVSAPMLILPKPMNEVIATELNNRAPGQPGISFAYEIGIKPGVVRPGKNKAAYEWVTKNLIEQSTADPLAQMRTEMLALPAPVTEMAKDKASK